MNFKELFKYSYDSEMFTTYKSVISHKHNWEKKRPIRISGFEKKYYWFKCKDCGLECVGRPRDKYEPPHYDFYVQKEDNLSCEEMIIKDILK